MDKNEEQVTEEQLIILEKFAVIQEKLENLVQQTKQTRKHIKRK